MTLPDGIGKIALHRLSNRARTTVNALLVNV